MSTLNANNIMMKYPGSIPVILEPMCKEINMYKKKFIVPIDFTFGFFMNIIRNYMSTDQNKSIVCLVDNQNSLNQEKSIPCQSSYLGSVYKNFKSIDNFLYVYVTIENTFGSI
jgi:hypothetical protein